MRSHSWGLEQALLSGEGLTHLRILLTQNWILYNLFNTNLLQLISKTTKLNRITTSPTFIKMSHISYLLVFASFLSFCLISPVLLWPFPLPSVFFCWLPLQTEVQIQFPEHRKHSWLNIRNWSQVIKALDLILSFE